MDGLKEHLWGWKKQFAHVSLPLELVSGPHYQSNLIIGTAASCLCTLFERWCPVLLILHPVIFFPPLLMWRGRSFDVCVIPHCMLYTRLICVHVLFLLCRYSCSPFTLYGVWLWCLSALQFGRICVSSVFFVSIMNRWLEWTPLVRCFISSLILDHTVLFVFMPFIMPLHLTTCW